MNNNLFEYEKQFGCDPVNEDNRKLNIFADSRQLFSEERLPAKKLTKTERAQLLWERIKTKLHELKNKAIENLANPFLSKTQTATTFILSEKTTLFGDKNSDVYLLLNLLSNKSPSIRKRAERHLMERLSDTNNKQIMYNFFKHNKEAQKNYTMLYQKVIE